jgi:hypothetical protein
VLDKDGSMAALQKAAQEFEWSPLQARPDDSAERGDGLCGGSPQNPEWSCTWT